MRHLCRARSSPVSLVALALVLTCAAGCGAPKAPDAQRLVRVEGTHFVRAGARYAFLGTNLWYGANLGAPARGGDRGRLLRELDLLRSLGIDNLRVMAASEGEGQPNTVFPPVQPELGVYDERVLEGLDFLLAEMGKRGMLAVVVLNNYWEWSGGMAQYVSWLDREPFPNPVFPEYSWQQFMEFSARFYAHEKANEAYRRFVAMLVGRTNRFTGVRYRDDPTIMAWQLANEPRPSPMRADEGDFAAFIEWVGTTASFIRSLDPNHLVSTGSEGLVGCLDSAETTRAIHAFAAIDYVTVHLWPLNWEWYDPLRPEQTYPETEEKALAYLDEHIALASSLGKPLVLEEFGIPRDRHSYSPASPTTIRDAYYELVFRHILENAEAGGPFAGSNFWTWGGYGRARNPDDPVWRRGDEFTGDPPQEPQGRNSVFATDRSTLAVVKRYAARMNALR
jgi:mannan endo-1,4-beta-mannosidase